MNEEIDMHWEPDDIAARDGAETMEGLADVGIFILSRMKKLAVATNREIIQFCGPMTTGGFGDEEKNFRFFTYHIQIAREDGYLVFNQVPFQLSMKRLCTETPSDGYHMQILEIFYRKIFTSGHVGRTWFIPRWETSRGTRWERNLMNDLPMIVAEDCPAYISDEALRRMGLPSLKTSS